MPMRFLALLNIVALCLPTGWCCWSGGPAECCATKEVRTEQPQAPHCPACAARGKTCESRPASVMSAPVQSREGCACQTPAPAVAAKWLALLDALPPAVALVPPAAARPAAVAGWLPIARTHGPPLHVLHCVWLC